MSRPVKMLNFVFNWFSLSVSKGGFVPFTLTPALSLRERGSVGWCYCLSARYHLPFSALRERGSVRGKHPSTSSATVLVVKHVAGSRSCGV